jgi:predicted amidohydrolase YtcJ
MATLIRNAQLWDGTGAAPFAAEVLVDGNRIRTVQRGAAQCAPDGVDVINALGMTLMPGLVEGHAHLSFCGATKNTDLGASRPKST